MRIKKWRRDGPQGFRDGLRGNPGTIWLLWNILDGNWDCLLWPFVVMVVYTIFWTNLYVTVQADSTWGWGPSKPVKSRPRQINNATQSAWAQGNTAYYQNRE